MTVSVHKYILYTINVYNMHMATKAKIIHHVDDLAANGRYSLTSRDVVNQLGISPQSATNALSRLVRDGVLDRVSRGHYATRQIGTLGTRAASENIALAVGAAFSNGPHRISHRSALAYHGLIVHPARKIQVSFARRVVMSEVSGRRLVPILETSRTIEIGSELIEGGARVSTVDRSILECANRPALAGGWGAIAQALQTGRSHQPTLERLARELNMYPALRRIASISDVVGTGGRDWRVRMPKGATRPIPLDPSDSADADPWVDSKWMVAWPEQPGRLIEALIA